MNGARNAHTFACFSGYMLELHAYKFDTARLNASRSALNALSSRDAEYGELVQRLAVCGAVESRRIRAVTSSGDAVVVQAGMGDQG